MRLAPRPTGNVAGTGPKATGAKSDPFGNIADATGISNLKSSAFLGQMILLQIPYPMGFYAKGLDGRIDDPNAGWKGRGVWSSSGDRTPWLKEGGKGTNPFAIHFQMRPDPLAH